MYFCSFSVLHNYITYLIEPQNLPSVLYAYNLNLMYIGIVSIANVCHKFIYVKLVNTCMLIRLFLLLE